MTGVKIVRQGYRYTIEHFGRFVRVAEPGFNYVTPFFYRVGRKINMMEQVLEIPGQEIITKDNAMVAVDGVVFFQVLDAAKAAYEVSDLYLAIMALSTTNLRTVMGSMDLDETLSKRDEINTRLLSVVDHATENWGVKITRVELRDIRPPQDIVNAMTRQMKAEREKRAVVLEAEGSRQSAILRAEGEKQGAILSAEGAREAAFREAEARERAAQAEAAATKAVSDAIESGSSQAINYFIAQKYVEAVAEFARSPNAKTILFPVEATQLIGTLGGIAELTKDALGGQRNARTEAEGRAERSQSRRMTGLPLDPGWLWLIGGVVLLIAEIIAPGFFLVFIGAAAIVTGSWPCCWGSPVALQMAIFAVLAFLAARIRRPACLCVALRLQRRSPAQRPSQAPARQESSWSPSLSIRMAAAFVSATANGRRAEALRRSVTASASSTLTAIA